MVKKVLFLMTMSLGMVLPVIAQNIPSYVPTNGLVGWWPFNGNANDESGNGNHGTVNGATSILDRFGNNDKAYSFNGLNNYISVDNNIISFDFGDNQSFSISLWVKTSYSCSNTSYCGGILSKMGVNTSNIGYQIGYNSTNKWNLEYNTNSVVQSPIHYYNGNIVDNQWHMITTCIDKVNNKIYFYTDGILTNIVSQNWFYKKTTNQNPLYFGRLRGGDYYYNGFIDDISIHNRVLTQQEITALYTSTTTCTNPTATITPQGNTTFCQGGFVNLNASTGANYTYQWYNNGQLINGATASTYQATTSGNYTVKVMDGTCNTLSSATSVTVNPNPTASITPQGNTTFCQGGFVNLNASTGANYTYQWYNNGQLINGVTTSTYQANTSGSYTVKVTDGSCSTTSSATTITVNPYPSPNVQASGTTSFCQGNNVTITSLGSGNYLWSNGATTKTITVTETGNYSVQVTQNGCTSTSSVTSVTVNSNPTASITPQGNTTFCQGGFVNLVASGGTSYQWNTGASSSSITANLSGTYTVNVFNSFGCQATASQVVTVNTNPTVTFNGLNEYTLKNQPFVQLTGTPTGGTFIGEGVQGSSFIPANVALGKKTITYNYTSPQGCSASATRSTFVVDSIGNVCNVTTYDTILKLKFKLTTGVSANQMTSMTLYPNPTTDVLYIEISDAKALDGYRYRILDAVGKEVYNQLVKNTKTEIPLKSLGAAGMYLFEVIDQQNKTIQSNKIVLE